MPAAKKPSPIETECRLEWCEAAIRYHELEAVSHHGAAAFFKQWHHAICYGRPSQ